MIELIRFFTNDMWGTLFIIIKGVSMLQVKYNLFISEPSVYPLCSLFPTKSV